jgi:hypothetical protein
VYSRLQDAVSRKALREGSALESLLGESCPDKFSYSIEELGTWRKNCYEVCDNSVWMVSTSEVQMRCADSDRFVPKQ